MERKLSALVAVDAATYAIDKPYEYFIPEELESKVLPGVRVRVQFGRGRRRAEGIILECRKAPSVADFKLKPILDIIDETPILDAGLIKLALWLREQCFCTFYDVVRVMLPSGVWHKAELQYIPVDSECLPTALKLCADIESGDQICSHIFNSKNPSLKSELEKLFGKVPTGRVVSKLLEASLIKEAERIVRNISDKTERLVRIDVSKEEIDEYIKRKRPKPVCVEAISMLEGMGAVTVRELSYFTGVTPAQLNTLKKNGIVHFENVDVYRRPKILSAGIDKNIKLNTQQEAVFKSLSAELKKGASCSLLHGVTGSGKTLIYFKLIEEVISAGKTAILLVPEISLTPQLLSKVYACFGERTAVMHSALSQGERYDEWKRIKNGEVDVVVGTRSAIFSPLPNIGIIILDEEQEDTYKSSQNPHYHARDAAKFRCVSQNAMLLLGSATPSIESMYYAKSGKYNLYTLSERFNEKPLPRVLISDMKKSLTSGSNRCIGKELYEELKKNIENGEQSILFLNRRGANKYVVCDDCGEVPGCPNCSVPLVYHSKNSRLMCHHCSYSERLEDACKHCGGMLRFVGFGTQHVETELAELFPGVEVIRMDMDTTSPKASHETLLGKFRDEKVPILLGTQMITKGLDFENVTLVGVLSADQSIFSESYKASESAFSLITQVIGRSGRGKKEGRAVIQTYSPRNFIIRTSAAQDYGEFYENESELRKIRNLPPFSDIFSLAFLAEKEIDAFNACAEVSRKAHTVLSDEYADISAKILGPTPAAIVKLNGKFRYKLVISTKNNKRSRDLVSRLVRDFLNNKKYKNISIIPDINTTDF